MRIFINNVDSYVGKALCADLRSLLGQENRIIGTVMADNGGEESRLWKDGNYYDKEAFARLCNQAARNSVRVDDGQVDAKWASAAKLPTPAKPDASLLESMGVKRSVSRADRKKYMEDIMSCSLIVFDLHSARAEDVEAVIKELKLAKLDQEKTFVLISSVNVWALTKKEDVKIENPDEDEPEDEENPRPAQYRPEQLSDKQKDRRTPAPKYEPWKYLETLALSLGPKEKLRPHVICAGILYGNGESTFNEVFKAAWLTQPPHAITPNMRQGEPLPGTNYIPCVHVRDVARLVRVVAADNKVERYLIAVDRAQLTQQEIIQGIVNQISDKKKVPLLPPRTVAEEELTDFQQVMTVDLIMQPSDPMKSKNFDWWCKKGLVQNLEKVADEFCRWRNLRPVKTMVMGPPGSGAENFCKQIADQYLHEEPPHLTYEKILEKACNDGTPAAARLQAKVARVSKGGKLKLKIRTKLVKKALMSNVCRYRGYVLEGYPKTYQEAEDLFQEKILAEGEEPPNEEEEEEEGEDEEVEDAPAPPPAEDEEEEEDADKPKFKLNTAIAPEFVVVLNSAEDRCKTRIFEGAAHHAGDDTAFISKTSEYQKANLTEDGSACTADFFTEIGNVKVFKADVDKQSPEEVFHGIRVYIESQGQFFNYLRAEEDSVREQQEKLASEEQSGAAQEEKRREALREQESGLYGERGKNEALRRQFIAEGEASLLDAESQPLKQYLMLNVVPTLTAGLSEVCKSTPEDPIEYLAQYLFTHAQDIAPQLDAAAGRGIR